MPHTARTTAEPLTLEVAGETGVQASCRLLDNGDYELGYHPDATAPLSLAMPLGAPADRTQVFPPLLQQNLPEGALRGYLIKQGEVASVPPSHEDLELARQTGRNPIGRLRTGPVLDQEAPSLMDSRWILGDDAWNDEILAACLKQWGHHSGVSGVQPKILAEVADDDPRLPAGRYLVKFEEPGYPGIARNEHLCLQVARLSGLAVADSYLSDDGERLLVRRFDGTVAGPLGFEELNTLDGRPTHGKYDGDYLDLVAIARRHVPEDSAAQVLGDLYAAIALSLLLRNGDAHAKNFGLLYDRGGKIRLAPVYDVLSTPFYLPDDDPALTLMGRKAWPSRADLLAFAGEIGLAQEQAERRLAAIGGGMEQGRALLRRQKDAFDDRSLAEYLERCWSSGLATLAEP